MQKRKGEVSGHLRTTEQDPAHWTHIIVAATSFPSSGSSGRSGESVITMEICARTKDPGGSGHLAHVLSNLLGQAFAKHRDSWGIESGLSLWAS